MSEGMGRTPLFDHEPVEGIQGLSTLTEPAADEPVRAVIDLPLIAGPGDGKTHLAATLLRSLRARAPELPEAESADNRRAMRAVMGGQVGAGEREHPGQVLHYTFRIPLSSLLEMLPGLGRAALLSRVGRAPFPAILILVIAAAAAGFAVALPSPLSITAPLSALALGGIIIWRWLRLVRVAAADGGDVEIVFWDPPGELYGGDRAADLYDFLANLSRARRAHQPAWRSYAFVPVLVVNPLGFAAGERSQLARLRGLLPLFAALGGRKPCALVAINRWALVAGACPPGSKRREPVAVTVIGDDDSCELELDREALGAVCVEAEDGPDGGVAITYLRYDAAADAVTQETNDRLEYRSTMPGAALSDEPRRRLAATLAELALRGSLHDEHQPFDDPSEPPAPSVYEPSGDRARDTLAAMTEAIDTGQEWARPPVDPTQDKPSYHRVDVAAVAPTYEHHWVGAAPPPGADS